MRAGEKGVSAPRPALGAALRATAGRPLARQFLRFLLVGGAATALHYAVMIALVEAVGVAAPAAAAAGFLAGAVVSYLANRAFTFQSEADLGAGLFRYAMVMGVGLLLNVALVWGLTGLGASYLLAQIAATGLVLFWNFFAARAFVFEGRRPTLPPA